MPVQSKMSQRSGSVKVPAACGLAACGLAGHAFLRAAPGAQPTLAGRSFRGACSMQASVLPSWSSSSVTVIGAMGLTTLCHLTGRTAKTTPGCKNVLAAAATFNPAEQIGAVEPLGFFDPIGFSNVGDGAEKTFHKLRSAELKHGRVAMLACVGAVVEHWVRFPGFAKSHGTFGSLLTPDGVLREEGGVVGLLFVTAFCEFLFKDSVDREPGNFGDPFGIGMYDNEMRTKEINNGRMAMISIAGIFTAELCTGKDAIEQLGFN